MIPESVFTWLAENRYGRVISSHVVGGGCINDCTRLITQSGCSFFLKTNLLTPEDMFAREAEGLAALRVEGGPRVPYPYLHGANFLLLEDLSPAPRQMGYWDSFGRGLAILHNSVNDHFGFIQANYIGSTPQPNPWMADGYTFFAEQRLIYQAELASQNGLLNRTDMQLVERLARKLTYLVPEQPASLIHGDLWGGNAITDERGKPAVIDPAVYYGWAEAELAMTTLFGAFPEAFYRAYQEIRPLVEGFHERFPIYNLYHLLNHLNLFGVGYLGEVLAVVRKYC